MEEFIRPDIETGAFPLSQLGSSKAVDSASQPLCGMVTARPQLCSGGLHAAVSGGRRSHWAWQR